MTKEGGNMQVGIALEFKFSDDPVPTIDGVKYVKSFDGEVASWDHAVHGALALLRHAEERAIFATGGQTIASQRLHALAEVLASVPMGQWYPDLAAKADKDSALVLDWKWCKAPLEPELAPCCAQLENARAWATGG